MNPFRSHGTGAFSREQLARVGTHVIFEAGVLVFHPEQIEIGENVYVGHQTILKGYYKNRMVIGDDTWIGQQCFFHSAGGLVIAQVKRVTAPCIVTNSQTFTLTYVVTGLSGSITRKVRLAKTAGTGTLTFGNASATNPSFILVEDIGV